MLSNCKKENSQPQKNTSCCDTLSIKTLNSTITHTQITATTSVSTTQTNTYINPIVDTIQHTQFVNFFNPTTLDVNGWVTLQFVIPIHMRLDSVNCWIERPGSSDALYINKNDKTIITYAGYSKMYYVWFNLLNFNMIQSDKFSVSVPKGTIWKNVNIHFTRIN